MRRTFVAFSLFFLLAPVVARADVAPPDDYVETCTLAIQQVEGTACEVCAWQVDSPAACTASYAGTDFTEVCSAWGGSNYDQIWCRDTGEATADEIRSARESNIAAATATADDGKGCAASPTSRGSWGLLLVAIGLLARRRRG